jgi:hypothetical protein
MEISKTSGSGNDDRGKLVSEWVKRPRPQALGNFQLRESDECLIAQMTLEHQAILRSEGAYAATAQKLRIPLGTVRSRLHRARAALTLLREQAASL